MKKILRIALAAMLTLSMTLGLAVASAPPVSHDLVVQTVRLLDIISGDAQGNLNLERQVTRAEFAKMLTSASPFKDAVTPFGYMLYTDVSATHWASPYVKIAVEQGWMVGYVDGTFRPDAPITLEAGVDAALKLLGYRNLPGSYPSAQLAKYYELDLYEGVTAQVGQPLTRNDCLYLFFNLMSAPTATGAVYAATLGHALAADGTLDINKLVGQYTHGPYIAQPGQSLAVPTTQLTKYYRNGVPVQSTALLTHDVFYHNPELDAIWIYSDRVTGRINGVNHPTAPTAVTVSGVTYPLETQDVAFQLSDSGSFATGDYVTLLLGQNGSVAGVVSATSIDNSYFGMVTSTALVSDATSTEMALTVAMTDGSVQQFASDGRDYEAGDLVAIRTQGGTMTISSLPHNALRGTVNDSGTAIGDLPLAADAAILEIHDLKGVTVYPSRLAGYTLEEENVRFYSLNAAGEISHLILEDCTGDAYTYALLTDVIEISAGMVTTSQYIYMSNGMPGVLGFENAVLGLETGGILFSYDEGAIDRPYELGEVQLTQLTETFAVGADRSFPLADQVQVYEKVDGTYYPVPVESISNLTQYELTGYYDDMGYAAGGQIRVIVAELA